MILVVGSTGMLGSEICRILASNGHSFRALVRETSDPEKVERLKGYGAELVKGDLRNLASLASACEGVDQVICTVSAMPFSYQPGENDIQHVDLEGVKNLVDTAKTAGVKHFIHTTFSKNIELDFPLHNAKRAVEQYLKASGLRYTILRPGYFMEVWLTPAVGFDTANAKASIFGNGDQKLSWISFKDVAQFAVESLDNPEAFNCMLELGGPEPLSPHQAIRLFESALDKTFEVVHVPREALQAQFDSAEDPMQKSFLGLMLCYVSGDPIDMSAIQRTFAVKLTHMEDYISSTINH